MKRRKTVIILQAQPMRQTIHNAVFAVVEPQQKPLRDVPVLSQEDYELFANIERAAKKMTKQDLLKAMGIML